MSDAKRRSSTRPASGKKLRAHFANIMASEATLPDDVRSRLVNRLSVYVSSARFRSEPPEVHLKPVMPATSEATSDAATNATSSVASDGSTAKSDPFDPYAFSVVALLSTEGEPALRKRLATAPDIVALKQLARAQRLSIARELLADADVTTETLVDAIVEAGEKRVANRMAAAG